MDWIYIPDLWHGKCLIFQIFGCPTCKLERILALTHHSTVVKIQGKHVFKHLTQCLALSINLCLALGINPALSINKYVIVVVISTSRFLLDSHLHGEQLAVRVVRFCPQAGSAPGAMKLPLCLPESVSYNPVLQHICCAVCYHFDMLALLTLRRKGCIWHTKKTICGIKCFFPQLFGPRREDWQ